MASRVRRIDSDSELGTVVNLRSAISRTGFLGPNPMTTMLFSVDGRTRDSTYPNLLLP